MSSKTIKRSVKPPTSEAITLPTFTSAQGKNSEGKYAVADMLSFMSQMPIETNHRLCGEYVLPLDVPTVWDLLFDDNAVMHWDGAKMELEHSIKEHSFWVESLTKPYNGKRVLAELSTIYESTFKSFLAQISGSTIFYELQKTYLTEKAENALVLHQVAKASGFKAADSYTIKSIIEVYQPDSAVEQSVLRLTWNNDWKKGTKVYEWAIRWELEDKQKLLTKKIFEEFLPKAKDQVMKLPAKLPEKKSAVKPKKKNAKESTKRNKKKTEVDLAISEEI